MEDTQIADETQIGEEVRESHEILRQESETVRDSSENHRAASEDRRAGIVVRGQSKHALIMSSNENSRKKLGA